MAQLLQYFFGNYLGAFQSHESTYQSAFVASKEHIDPENAPPPRLTRHSQTWVGKASDSVPEGMELRPRTGTRYYRGNPGDLDAYYQPQQKKRKLNNSSKLKSRSSSVAVSKAESETNGAVHHIPGRLFAPKSEGKLQRLLRQIPDRNPERPWYSDVLNSVPEALDVVEKMNLSDSRKSDFLFYVELHFVKGEVKEYYLKVFGDYEAGWAESSMTETVARVSRLAASRKLRPEIHGPCVRRLGRKESDHQLGYFALMPPAGISLPVLVKKKINLDWSLTDFCREILAVLRSLAACDPDSSDIHFYHGDTNEHNYLLDLTKKRFTMIDFGRSYFQWPGANHPSVLTPRRDGLPPNMTSKDIKTFYTVVSQIIPLPNASKRREDWNVWLALGKFVSRKNITAAAEPHCFAQWCQLHDIKIS